MKKTIVQTAKDSINMNREIVMNILDLDDLEHNTFLFNLGIEFLNQYAPGMENEYHLVLRDKMYWNWFRNEFSIAQDKWIKIHATVQNLNQNRARISYRLYMNMKFTQEENIFLSFDNYLDITTNERRRRTETTI